MADQRYLPKDLKGKMEHVIEEAAEFTQAYVKYLRFGAKSVDPRLSVPETNEDAMLREARDLRDAVSSYIEERENTLPPTDDPWRP